MRYNECTPVVRVSVTHGTSCIAVAANKMTMSVFLKFPTDQEVYDIETPCGVLCFHLVFESLQR